MNKKAQIANAFSSLPSIAILLGIAIVIFSVMAQVTEDVQKTGITGVSNTSGNVIEGVSFCNSTNEINCSYRNCTSTDTSGCSNGVFNMSTKGLDLFNNIGAQFPLLGTITILGIIVLTLIGIFGSFFVISI